MTRLFLSLAVVLAISSGGAAQSRPDYSGKWTMDEARSESPTHEGFTGPVVWTIKQSADVLLVDIQRGPKTVSMVYKVVNKPAGGLSVDGVPSYRAYWEGDRLVTETAQNIQGQTVTTKEFRTLQPNGEMMVERLVTVEHGYTLKGAQNYGTAKDIFKRANP